MIEMPTTELRTFAGKRDLQSRARWMLLGFVNAGITAAVGALVLMNVSFEPVAAPAQSKVQASVIAVAEAPAAVTR
jgi:hypothetical protein